jgi:hypothetical protein
MESPEADNLKKEETVRVGREGGGVQNITKSFPTKFSGAVGKMAWLARPAIDAFHYRPMERNYATHTRSPASVENPYELDVPYRALLTWSYPLGILAAHGDINAVIANYYGSLFFPKAKINGAKDVMIPRILPAYTLDTFSALGYLESEIYDLMLEDISPGRVIDFVIESVAQGWYISTNANKYYIPGPAHRWYDFRHPILVTGFNGTERSFTIITYTSNGEYGRVCVAQHLLGRALISRATFERMIRTDYRNTVRRLRLFRPRKVPLAVVDCKSIAEQMKNYLAAIPPPFGVLNPIQGIDEFDHPAHFTERCLFGIATYEGFRGYFDYIHRSPKHFDARVTRTLVEHKKMMLSRIELLERSGFVDQKLQLSARFRPIAHWAQAIHLGFVARWRGVSRGADLAAVIGRESEMRIADKQTIECTLKALSVSEAVAKPT